MTPIAQPLADCDPVLRLVRQRAGLAFTAGRQAAAETTIRRAMASSALTDPLAFCRLLREDAARFADLLDELTVGETYFFRELGHFDLIRRRILPALAARGPGHIIRAWSAGCASGEEAYSLAIVLEQAGLADRAHLLATDISPAALAKARAGIYRQWSLRGPGRELAQAYLRRDGDRYLLDAPLRDRVTFEALNLALDVYPAMANGTWGVDLILCRNVLIYFDRETVAAVARRLFHSLAPGGCLITASSDPALGELAPFEVVVADEGIFYRRPVAAEKYVPARPTREWRSAPPTEVIPVGVEFNPPTTSPLPDRRPEAMPAPVARQVDAGGSAADLAQRVRALANVEAIEAERVCAAALECHPVSAELHFLRAVLLMGLGRAIEAAESARKAIFLDRSLAIVHFTLGTVLQGLGDVGGARKALRNARHLAAARPADELVPLGDGERAGRLAEAAAAQLALLEQAGGSNP